MEKAIQAFAQVPDGTRVVIASLYSRHSPPLTLIVNWTAILRASEGRAAHKRAATHSSPSSRFAHTKQAPRGDRERLALGIDKRSSISEGLERSR